MTIRGGEKRKEKEEKKERRSEDTQKHEGKKRGKKAKKKSMKSGPDGVFAYDQGGGPAARGCRLCLHVFGSGSALPGGERR